SPLTSMLHPPRNATLFPYTTLFRSTDRKNSGGTSTVLNWDSHNYVTLAVDKAGFIHLAGNMHVHPITYFRSTKPHDISEMIQVRSEEHTSELQSREISYAVVCLKKK